MNHQFKVLFIILFSNWTAAILKIFKILIDTLSVAAKKIYTLLILIYDNVFKIWTWVFSRLSKFISLSYCLLKRDFFPLVHFFSTLYLYSLFISFIFSPTIVCLHLPYIFFLICNSYLFFNLLNLYLGFRINWKLYC